MNIVKTTKIYESDAAISEVGGNFTDLSLWVFWKESGTIKAKALFKDNVLDANGLYIGSLADPEWSEEAILSNNTDDHYPALFMTGDDSGILLWGRDGEIYTLPAVVLKDLLDGNFKYRYSDVVSLTTPRATFGDTFKATVTWDSPTDTTQKYLCFIRLDDATTWTAVEKYTEIPDVDSASTLHLRMIMYSTETGEYSIPTLDQVKIIFYLNSLPMGWSSDQTVSIDWKTENLQQDTWKGNYETVDTYTLTICGLCCAQKAYTNIRDKNQLNWK